MMLKSFALLAFVLWGAHAQLRCISPSAMMANVSVSEYSEQRKELFHGRIGLYYDAFNQKIRTDDYFAEIPDLNKRGRFRVISDWKEKVRFLVNLDTGECRKEPVTTPFQPLEIPTAAIYRGDVYVGVEGVVGASLRAALWVGQTPESGGRYAGLWTANCLPVLDFYRSANDWRHWNLYDVLNNVDSSAFDIPKECF